MAQFSLTISRWRMLRRAIKSDLSQFRDIQNNVRHDKDDAEWLVANGFLALINEELYELTEKGRASADMGFYEPDWPSSPASEPEPAPAPKRPRKK